MMRAVVTGSTGQVATALAAQAKLTPDLDLTFLARPRFDLQNPEEIANEIERLAPDAVLSVAAYTAVDAAEDEPEVAMDINGTAPGMLAAAAGRLNIPIVHLSTDYVFSGVGTRPFSETDETAPVTSYGRSKLAGEQEIARANRQHVILRTAWVYSAVGRNFVKTMLALAAERDQLSVVNDQVGNPTSATDIANGVICVLQALGADASNIQPFGVFHMAGAEEASWFDFAQEIFRLSAGLGGPVADVVPVESSAYPTKAIRPQNSRLDCAKFKATFNHALPGYRQALPGVIEALLAEQ